MMGVLVELIERLRLRIIVKRNKKIYSYNNWLWIYCHEIHDAFVSNTTMHPVNVPWEFLEHHTDYEIMNTFNKDELEHLEQVSRMAKNSPDFGKYVKRMVRGFGLS